MISFSVKFLLQYIQSTLENRLGINNYSALPAVARSIQMVAQLPLFGLQYVSMHHYVFLHVLFFFTHGAAISFTLGEVFTDGRRLNLATTTRFISHPFEFPFDLDRSGMTYSQEWPYYSYIIVYSVVWCEGPRIVDSIADNIPGYRKGNFGEKPKKVDQASVSDEAEHRKTALARH